MTLAHDRMADALREIAKKLPSDFTEALRTDHPLQGETLGGITDALNAIAEGLFQVAKAIREHNK